MKFFDDPFICNLVLARQNMALDDLINKAKILVPNSAVIMGVIDEDGILEEDEVFVQIKRDNYPKDGGQNNIFGSVSTAGVHDIDADQDRNFDKLKKISSLVQQIDARIQNISGDVIVTRNPCTHPGDVRRLKARSLSSFKRD